MSIQRSSDEEPSNIRNVDSIGIETNETYSGITRFHFFVFVFSTFLVWLIILLITAQFQMKLSLSMDTVRDMVSASIAFAGIPFTILSLLGVFKRSEDNYFIVSLAGLAIIFLIAASACFWILWTRTLDEPINIFYSIKIVVGFIGVIIIQILWVGFSRNARFRYRASLDGLLFVISFVVVQISSISKTGDKLLEFTLLGFIGGVIALIVLVFVAVYGFITKPTVRPKPEEDKKLSITQNIS